MLLPLEIVSEDIMFSDCPSAVFVSPEIVPFELYPYNRHLLESK